MMIILSWYLKSTLFSDHILFVSSKKFDFKLYVQLWLTLNTNITNMLELICFASGSANLTQSARQASLSVDWSCRIEKSRVHTKMKFWIQKLFIRTELIVREIFRNFYIICRFGEASAFRMHSRFSPTCKIKKFMKIDYGIRLELNRILQ